GVIVTGNLERRGDLLRTLQVVKMRGTTLKRAKYVVDLTTSGVLLVPLLKGGSVTGSGWTEHLGRGLGEAFRLSGRIRRRASPEGGSIFRRDPGHDRPVRNEERPRGRLRHVDNPEPEHPERDGGPRDPGGSHLVRRLHHADYDVPGEAPSPLDRRRESDDAREHHAEGRVPPPQEPGPERPRRAGLDQQPLDPQQHEDPERVPPHPGEQPARPRRLLGHHLDAGIRDGRDPEHARARVRRGPRTRGLSRWMASASARVGRLRNGYFPLAARLL